MFNKLDVCYFSCKLIDNTYNLFEVTLKNDGPC
jgi:hypothetical protein